jgi:hypothetical protein
LACFSPLSEIVLLILTQGFAGEQREGPRGTSRREDGVARA